MSQSAKIITHLLFWLIFEGMALYTWMLPFYSPGPGHILLFTSTTIAALISSLIYFYVNYGLLIPYYCVKKKYYVYSFLLLLNLTVFVISRAYVWHNFHFVEGLFSKDFQIGSIVYHCIIYYFFSVTFYILESWRESELIKELLEKEVRETELLYLKSQMNPHFLFNTLNNIYGLSLKGNDATSSAIRQLKEMMAYNDNFSQGKKITISDELRYLNSYINLFRLRNSSKVNFISNIYSDSIEIEPMLLLPFVENAFKHGANTGGASIDIMLNAGTDGVFFKVTNSINQEKRKDSTGGIGIKNVRRRLELLYTNNHSLKSVIKNNQFTIELQMNGN